MVNSSFWKTTLAFFRNCPNKNYKTVQDQNHCVLPALPVCSSFGQLYIIFKSTSIEDTSKVDIPWRVLARLNSSFATWLYHKTKPPEEHFSGGTFSGRTFYGQTSVPGQDGTSDPKSGASGDWFTKTLQTRWVFPCPYEEGYNSNAALGQEARSSLSSSVP